MKNRNEIMQNLALITQLGISMLAPVILCVFAGSWLDGRYGWNTVLPLLILGILAGVRNCYLLLKPLLKEKEGKEHEE